MPSPFKKFENAGPMKQKINQVLKYNVIPSKILELFITDEFVNQIVKNTNRKALVDTKFNRRWNQTTYPREIKAFIASMLYKGIHRYKNTNDHFTPFVLLRSSLSLYFTYSRCRVLAQYLTIFEIDKKGEEIINYKLLNQLPKR